MTKDSMTIHRALAELKTLDDRIENAISDGVFCVSNRHNNEKISGISVNDYKSLIQGSYDKVSDLIKRRNTIKRAVVFSNATTEVTISGVPYTVAEAIEMKNHGMELYEEMYAAMKSQYNHAQAHINRENDSLQKRAEDYVTGMYGKENVKVDPEGCKKMTKDFIEANTYELIDPIKIHDKLVALEEEISTFKSEVDAVLSESNAITLIDIEY